jgi:2'-5' RNA ligase
MSAAAFDALWNKFAPEVKRTGGQRDIDFPPGRPGFTVTLVARVSLDLARRVTERMASFKADFPVHYHYPATDLHLTIFNCDDVLQLDRGGPLNDESIARLADLIRGQLMASPPFPVQLVGLGVFPTTVFVQAHDPEHGVNALRDRMRSIGFPTTDISCLPPFVNVIRFLEPASAALVDLVGSYRNTDFGSFVLEEVELVATDKFLSVPNTRILDRFRLGG